MDWNIASMVWWRSERQTNDQRGALGFWNWQSGRDGPQNSPAEWELHFSFSVGAKFVLTPLFSRCAKMVAGEMGWHKSPILKNGIHYLASLKYAEPRFRPKESGSRIYVPCLLWKHSVAFKGQQFYLLIIKIKLQYSYLWLSFREQLLCTRHCVSHV